MLRREIEPIFGDILNWSIIIIGISIGISILSIFITVDFSESSASFIEIFVLNVSNFSFFLGMLAIFAGLLIIFFKRPEGSGSSKRRNKEFKPKYKKGQSSLSKPPFGERNQSNLSKSSKRDQKLILSGIISIAFAIIIWAGYSIFILI
jgi:hypothetical protein